MQRHLASPAQGVGSFLPMEAQRKARVRLRRKDSSGGGGERMGPLTSLLILGF